MIGISKLYCGTIEPSDALRYGRRSANLPSHLLQFSEDKKPVVVWNITRKCNLRCVHCYAHADPSPAPNELSTAEGKALIDSLAEFGCPVILFSGGEPLMREDLLELVAYAVEKGMRAVISTNGTLITARVATEMKSIGLSYVGISLDGLEAVNDRFRGVRGAFGRAMDGIAACQEAGIKVGLRFTINRRNASEIPAIFDLVEERRIPRICFYHLVYAGRGSALMSEDLSHEETRRIVDLIIDRTAELHRNGKPTEVLTVDNHADGPYLYLRMVREGSPRASQVLELLKMNEGNNSGRG
ncbi:MAG: radical SAM protein, partial [Thermodesulforhabdaceae bacterium]